MICRLQSKAVVLVGLLACGVLARDRDFFHGFEVRTTVAVSNAQVLVAVFTNHLADLPNYSALLSEAYKFAGGPSTNTGHRFFVDVPVEEAHRQPVRLFMLEKHGYYEYCVADIGLRTLSGTDRIEVIDIENRLDYTLDMDGDTLSVATEIGLNTSDFAIDSDNDLWPDQMEVQGTNIVIFTKDSTHLVNTRGTNPSIADSDFDNVPDGWEILSHPPEYPFVTDPNNPDTDGDGACDGYDNQPLDGCTTNYHGVPLDWIYFWTNGLSRWNLSNVTAEAVLDADGDADGDGVPNWIEFKDGTIPIVSNGHYELRFLPSPVVVSAAVGAVQTVLFSVVDLSWKTATGMMFQLTQPWAGTIRPIGVNFRLQYGTNNELQSAEKPVRFVPVFGMETRFSVEISATNTTDNTTYRDTLRATIGGVTNECELLLCVGAQPGLNHAPNVPALVAPGNGVQLPDVRNQWLVWNATNDPDGDAVVYDVSIGYAFDEEEPCLVISNVVASSNLAWSVELEGELQLEPGVEYWWQVAARDEHGAATVSARRLFTTPPPLLIAVVRPGNGEVRAPWDAVVLEAFVTNGTSSCAVTFYTNAWGSEYAQAGDVQTMPPYRMTLGTLPAGWFSVYAMVADSAGLTSRSAVTTFSIDAEGRHEPLQSDVERLAIRRGAAYGLMSLSWNSNKVDVLACTNRYYSVNPADWFVLAEGVPAPWMHEDATNFASVYYRIVSGPYTSAFDVGKFDVDINAGSIAWIAYPFTPQEGYNKLSDWFGQQLEARQYCTYTYPLLQVQSGLGGSVVTRSYYINDGGLGGTNWFPDDDPIKQNAGYVLFLWNDHPGVRLTSVGMVPTNSIAISVPYQTIPWAGLSYPVRVNMRDSGVTNLFTPARLYSGFDYDFIDSQNVLGGSVQYAEYFFFDWGDGSTDFFPSQPSADYFEAGKAYLLFFSTSRTGSGTWQFIRRY